MERQIKREPVYDEDVVNKKYVDKLIKELNEKIAKLENIIRNGG